ncbi:MAG TPA: type VI secretion system lipoprotein TssJ [Burkholderiaceae bacterium]|nr:type VI secretion system lipoprotein TssJ [Burkholderiaceae bacterium]
MSAPPVYGCGRLWPLAALLAWALSACAVPPSTPLIGSKETSVSARITAAPGLNADTRKRPSPLVLRVYELAGRNAFDTSDFVSLYERDKDTLAADLVTRDELVLQPGEVREWKKTLAPQTRFIAVIGAYREIERANWRAVLPIKTVARNALVIQAEDLAVKLAPAPQ